ncbi:hypothetical protein CPB83DRAFT_268658 [Crepidotus variabilis]|uniref:F-box domain-containing protein n=1 Tax=Crepidotus variabilis TaxID=179855 RepID=A0A9P6E093_9AGAR|nr:hypothetical protein CPB83DRAFT_268658 [Crepidotus variabilis]
MASSDRQQRRITVEVELASAVARISQLQLELFDIRQRLNDTTPILDMLPEDVMVEVFQYLLPSHPDPEIAGYGCSLKPIQLTLGAVCRTWRSITWSFPAFWKELRFTFAAKSDDAQAEIQVDLVQEWVRRTGNLPLQISLLLRKTKKHAVLDGILRILLQECQRWRSLEVAGKATHRLRKKMFEGSYIC